MRPYWLFALVFLSACGGHAGPHRLAPAAPLAISPSAAPLFYVVPFSDRRSFKGLYKGRSPYEDVNIAAEGITLSSRAWQDQPYGSVALLWHRQLAQSLHDAGLAVAVADEPIEDESVALSQAGDKGAKYLLSGRIQKLEIGKKGADDLMGTNFSGTNYPMLLTARLKAVEVASGQAPVSKDWTYKRVFYDPTRLGAPDYKTFPSFFLVGLKDATVKLAQSDELRGLAGLPPVTPTSTPTPTPLAVPPTPGPSPTPMPTVEPTPDLGPHWVNPKTGKKVDPNWNFDPEDGTPRKDFILRQPTPKPTPARVTAPR